ncbi:MAG: mechanosensitive ion channel family protein [Crocosphaera sp.]
METFWTTLTNINASGFPIGKIAVVVIILAVTQFLRVFLTGIILKRLERLTSKTETTLDDELIGILKPCLSGLILIGGLYLSKDILSDNLGANLSQTIDQFLNLIVILIIAYFVYRASSILGQIIAEVLLHTDSELDELLKPLMPKIFQAIAIILIALKISEMFLGQSAAALVGLLGGAGITLGLLFKDILYDWFCTIIIYSDAIYKEGDWLVISGFSNMVQVLNVGFRTTTIHDTVWGCITKMPNSKMISGIVANWSQNAEDGKFGINLHLKIDGISAQQTSRICEGLEKLPASIEGCYEKCLVRFKKIEQNARVIEIRAHVTSLSFYFAAERKLNLAILDLLEREGIDCLYIELETDPERNKREQQAGNN